ncbi:MAG: hypothetical protein ACFFAJ_18695 [Candidatus Hodarchaeota archaeon]
MSYTIAISSTDFQLIKYFIYLELLGLIFLIPMFLLFIFHYTRGIPISEKPIILLGFGLLLNMPISLHRVLESINDGVIVLDRDFRIMNITVPSQLDLIKVLKKVIDLHTDRAVIEEMEIIFKEQNKSYDVLRGELLYELFSNLIENALNHSNGTML